jgi:hypothetical protein
VGGAVQAGRGADDRGGAAVRGGAIAAAAASRGNRCFAHFEAKRYEAAEAACAQGLAIATVEEIRGAIFYSLGRIAEARGDGEAALVFYRTSLALRHDEAAEKRFERLK